MPQYPLVERIGLKALTSIYGTAMAMPRNREVYPQFQMTVTAVRRIAEHVVRVTCQAEELRTFERYGADEYFGLIFPANGRELRMPSGGRINIRAEITKMSEEHRPELRWYTIRDLDRDAGTIDVDIVTHGDDGPGSAWATRAEVGQRVGFRAGTSAYRICDNAPRQLLVADEAAIPALAAISADLRAAQVDTSQFHAFIEIPDEGHAPPIDASFEVTTLVRGNGAPGSKVLNAIESRVHPDYDYAWTCGESAIATGVRRHLVKTLEMPRKSVYFSGYWKVGSARR